MRSTIQFAIGLVLIAIVARVFLVMGLLVPVTVAGSSMVPTLSGPHVAAECQHCGEVTRIGADQLPPAGQLACERCGLAIDAKGLPVHAGDSIWIDRAAFVLCPPRRWELVVFQCPDDASQLCVKRVLGLPGEKIALRGGNLFVDDAHVPKPLQIDYELRPGDGIRQRGFDLGRQCWQLEGGFFVVGDNQAVSLDSRNWPAGPDLSPKLLLGRPWVLKRSVSRVD